jgi:hypothetical protein
VDKLLLAVLFCQVLCNAKTSRPGIAYEVDQCVVKTFGFVAERRLNLARAVIAEIEKCTGPCRVQRRTKI